MAGLGVEPLGISGLVVVRAPVYEDARGVFSEVFRADMFAEHGLPTEFLQDNYSLSKQRHTVRGLHFQGPPRSQGKLVRVDAGTIFDVVVDIRTDSPSFGAHVALELNSDDRQQVWIPPGFAHGFCTLTTDAVVVYKLTEVYAPEAEGGIAWDDPALGIEWPVEPEQAVVSERDRRHPRLAELVSPFRS